MKLRALLAMMFFGLIASVNAGNIHQYPNTNTVIQEGAQSVKPHSFKSPGYCEIEIFNYSFSNVVVSGTFDDGSPLLPFVIYSFEDPHYITLFYYGYCHPGMNLYIETLRGSMVYSAYTTVGSSIRITIFSTSKTKK